ncbi:MAG: hypothetical protein ACHQAY_24525 [Hyphomicrobiales bacterium]
MYGFFGRWALICLAALSGLWAPRLLAAEPGAKDFLATLYANYTGKAKGVDYTNPASVKRYLTPELGALLLRKMKADAKKSGEVPDLDGDPYVDAQDWVITELAIAVAESGPDRATGTRDLQEPGRSEVHHARPEEDQGRLAHRRHPLAGRRGKLAQIARRELTRLD